MFPEEWTIAQVPPLHKEGVWNDINNHRPISILHTLSKILEKHVANSLLKFLRDNNLIYNLQSAFRTSHSTETALIRLTDEILLNMDKDEVTGLVFIDFLKAFDTVDHKLLLRKLAIYGASDAAVSWIKSYLSNRKQFVKLGNQSSELLPIKQGVPQGSILRPVLFLLFVNDMPLNIFKSSMDIYADDTTISSSANWNEIPKLQEALLEDLKKVEKWSRTNSMYLNPSKTKAMLVVGKRLRKRFDGETSSLQLSLNDKEIEIVRSHKLLGLKIDQD